MHRAYEYLSFLNSLSPFRVYSFYCGIRFARSGKNETVCKTKSITSDGNISINKQKFLFRTQFNQHPPVKLNCDELNMMNLKLWWHSLFQPNESALSKIGIELILPAPCCLLCDFAIKHSQVLFSISTIHNSFMNGNHSIVRI